MSKKTQRKTQNVTKKYHKQSFNIQNGTKKDHIYNHMQNDHKEIQKGWL